MAHFRCTAGDDHFWDPSNITEPGEFSLAFTRYHNDASKAAMDAARTTDDEAARAEQWAVVWREVATAPRPRSSTGDRSS